MTENTRSMIQVLVPQSKNTSSTSENTTSQPSVLVVRPPPEKEEKMIDNDTHEDEEERSEQIPEDELERQIEEQPITVPVVNSSDYYERVPEEVTPQGEEITESVEGEQSTSMFSPSPPLLTQMLGEREVVDDESRAVATTKKSFLKTEQKTRQKRVYQKADQVYDNYSPYYSFTRKTALSFFGGFSPNYNRAKGTTFAPNDNYSPNNENMVFLPPPNVNSRTDVYISRPSSEVEISPVTVLRVRPRFSQTGLALSPDYSAYWKAIFG